MYTYVYMYIYICNTRVCVYIYIYIYYVIHNIYIYIYIHLRCEDSDGEKEEEQMLGAPSAKARPGQPQTRPARFASADYCRKNGGGVASLPDLFFVQAFFFLTFHLRFVPLRSTYLRGQLPC